MGILRSFFEGFKRPPGPPPMFAPRRAVNPLLVRGAFDPDRAPDWLARRAADWSMVDEVAGLQDTVRKCVVAIACATYLADAVAEAPLRVYRQQGDDDPVPEEEHPARLVLTNPNPFMDEAEFWALLVMQMALQGYGVIEKVRSGAGLPVQLWPLRPDWLVARRTTAGTIHHWDYRALTMRTRSIPTEDIVIVPFRHDYLMESPGMAPAAVAAREIGVDSALTDFLKVFLDSGGIPPFVLTHPDPIYDEAVVDAMQEKWRQKYGGSRAYGTLPIIHGGFQINEIGGSIDEMAWPDLRGLTELKICQAFRVPAELVQGHMTFRGGSSLTSTEIDGAMAQLQRYGAAPLRTRIDGALSRGFLREFTGGDPDWSLGFDTSDVLALQEDVDELHTRVRADYDAGLISLDEARIETKRKPLPNKQGEVFKVAFSTILTPASALASSTTPTTTPAALPSGQNAERRYRDVKALSAKALAVRASALERTQRDRQRLAEIGTRQLRKFWTEQGARIVDALNRLSAQFPMLSTLMTPDTPNARAEAHDMVVKALQDIAWEEERRLLEQLLARFHDANGGAAFATSSALLGSEVVWDVSNPLILRLMGELGIRIVGIAEQTRLDVSRVVTEALVEGVTIPELGQRLTGLFEETYRGRAETVARTESQVAYNRASALAYRQSGVVDEVELHDNGQHTEGYGASDGLTCAERNGLVVQLVMVDGHVHAEHPNGSLAVLPIVREDGA